MTELWLLIPLELVERQDLYKLAAQVEKLKLQYRKRALQLIMENKICPLLSIYVYTVHQFFLTDWNNSLFYINKISCNIII